MDDFVTRLAKVRADLIGTIDQTWVGGVPQKNNGMRLPQSLVDVQSALKLLEGVLAAELAVHLKYREKFDANGFLASATPKPPPAPKDYRH